MTPLAPPFVGGPEIYFFVHVDIRFDVAKCKFILKNSNLKYCLCFRLFLWR